MTAQQRIADVCLILEGTYPYVTGGVSTWTHDLIAAHKDLSFHLITLLPIGASMQLRYSIPENVVSHSTVFVQQLPDTSISERGAARLCQQLEGPLLRIPLRGGVEPLASIIDAMRPFEGQLGKRALLNSRAAWDLLRRMYDQTHPESSFLDYFWSWRALLGGLYSILLSPLPEALVYHTVSTGYAGLLATRAALEHGRPMLLTEHGIYTNERRIEIGMADWLHTSTNTSWNIESRIHTLKDLWINTFVGYSRACYEVASEIITLFEGNQQFQLEDGAPPDKLRVIPNGIDYEAFSSIRREARTSPTIALIGRVVPIKDVKTFVRACGVLKDRVPGLRALIIGPTDEDPEYFRECKILVHHLGLEETVIFTGRVKLKDYLGRIDVCVLTSISEAQPLTILEAGAVGIPNVTTDVGACREMLTGRSNESPALGPGGAVTPLCNPVSTAAAVERLLTDPHWYSRCSRAIQERVRSSYNKTILDRTYRDLYDTYRRKPTVTETSPYCEVTA